MRDEVFLVQTLGLSSSTPKTESRLKTLFWPTIQYDTDVDLIARQGFWVCFIVAVATLAFGVWGGMAAALGACAVGLFFFLAGIGCRQRDRFAAIVAALVYFASSVAGVTAFSLFSVVQIIFMALLFANIRATWIASWWERPAAQAAPEPAVVDPVIETFGDKIADRMPAVLWPKIKWLFYVYAVIICLLVCIGVVMMSIAPHPRVR